MSILVDTSVWSLALRRSSKPFRHRIILSELISNNLVEIIDPIRQELLSGISERSQFEKLKNHLSHFSDTQTVRDDFELAAEFFNRCRKKGIQGSHTDFLICAVAFNHALQIFTMDNDFNSFKKVLPITLFNWKS